MKNATYRHCWLISATWLACLALVACGSGLSGTYESRNGFMSIEFKADKAYVSMPAGTVEAEYKVDGDKVIIHNEGGNMVLRKKADGSLDGPMGTLRKKKT